MRLNTKKQTEKPKVFKKVPFSDYEQPEEKHTIHDPQRNQEIDINDKDTVIEFLDRMLKHKQEVMALINRVSEIITSWAPGKKKTERVRGDNWIAKITKPSDKWDQSLLQEAWNSFPKFRNEILKLTSISVKKREYNKAISTSGDKDWNCFIDIVKKANLGAIGKPRVTVEPNEK